MSCVRVLDAESGGLRCSALPPYSISRVIFTNLWHISKSRDSYIPFVSATQSKICKRSWVLHECVERVPENVDAAKELLQYGLKGTDLEALIAIGNREDGGRWGTIQSHVLHISICQLSILPGLS